MNKHNCHSDDVIFTSVHYDLAQTHTLGVFDDITNIFAFKGHIVTEL